MASPGTVANVKHFKITNDFPIGTFPIGQERNLANHIVLYGEKGDVPGAKVAFTNLHTSLFHRVLGPNTVIKNIDFHGNGNIAREFSGIMDNVHHVTGSMSNLNVNDTGAIGGLVDISSNATFRRCSNSANVLLSTGSGGARPVNGGIIGEARGNIHIINTYNRGHIETFLADIEATGGLVGRIANNLGEEAVIELSFNGDRAAPNHTTTGQVNGRRSGGLVGKKEGNGSLVIRESSNYGWIRNRDTTRAESAGILAWATGGNVRIENCYNRGNVVTGANPLTTTDNLRTTGASGIFSTNNGATVVVTRTYNTGLARRAIAAAGAGVTVTTGTDGGNFVLTNTFSSGQQGNAVTVANAAGMVSNIGVNGLPAAVFANPAVAPISNSSLNGGYPVLVGIHVHAYTFNANGGIINTTGGAVTSIRFTQAQPNWATVITGNPVREHYDFEGWSEDAQAPSGVALASITAPISQTRVYYAVWSAKKYTINFVNSGGDFATEQTYQLLDGEGPTARPVFDSTGVLAPSTQASFVIGQNITLRTEIREGTSLNMGYVRFVEWRIAPTGAGFERFNYGRSLGDPFSPTRSARLDIWESNGHIIDDEFINLYTHAGTMTILGFYEYIDTGESMFELNVFGEAFENGAYVRRPDWGISQIDDGNIVRDFQSLDAWTPIVDGESAIVRAKPNTHYTLVRFDIITSGGTLPVTPARDTTTGFYFYELEDIDQDYEIRVVLKRTQYKVTVTARTIDDDEIDDDYLDDLVGTQRAFHITIGSTFSDITLSSSGAYRLFHPWENNHKIKLPGTTNYERRRSETNGQIIIRQTDFESFMDQFWGTDWCPDTDEIEIVAIFVLQVELSLAITSEDFSKMGTVVIEITHPDPEDTFSATMFNGVPSRGFRFGSMVEIFIELFDNARVQNIKVNDTGRIQDLHLIGDVYQDQRTMSFTFELLDATFIDITFEIDDYVFNLAIVDEARPFELTHPLPIFEKVEILDLLHTEGREWRGERLGINDIIRLTLEREIEWSNDWQFGGVYIIYEDESGLVEEEFDTEGRNVPVITPWVFTIELDDLFVETYLEESTEFTIEVRFARIFNVNVRLALASSGDVINADTGLSIVGRRPFPVGATLKLRLAPADYYELPRTGVVVADLLNPANPIPIKTDAQGSYIELDVTKEHDIRVHFTPEQVLVDTSGSQANGEISNNNLTEVGIGTEVIIQFKPGAGLQRSSWTINGVDIYDISELYGMTVRISGNTVSFTINEQWFGEHFGELHSIIGTQPNTMLIIAAVVGGIVVVALIVGLVFLIIANKKRRAEYALAREKMKIAKARMGHADLIKGLREG